jgi:hypothetical protein
MLYGIGKGSEVWNLATSGASLKVHSEPRSRWAGAQASGRCRAVRREDDHTKPRAGESTMRSRDPVPPAEDPVLWPDPSPLNEWWQAVMKGNRSASI